VLTCSGAKVIGHSYLHTATQARAAAPYVDVASSEQLAPEVSEAELGVASLAPRVTGPPAHTDRRTPRAELPSVDDAAKAATDATGATTGGLAPSASSGRERAADESPSPALPIPSPAGANPSPGDREQASCHPGAGRARSSRRRCFGAADTVVNLGLTAPKACRWAVFERQSFSKQKIAESLAMALIKRAAFNPLSS